MKHEKHLLTVIGNMVLDPTFKIKGQNQDFRTRYHIAKGMAMGAQAVEGLSDEVYDKLLDCIRVWLGKRTDGEDARFLELPRVKALLSKGEKS